MALGSATPPPPPLPLLTELQSSFLDPVQEKIAAAPLKQGPLPPLRRLPQISPGESAWRRLELKNSDLDRFLPLSGRDLEESKWMGGLVREADTLGSSLQVVASLAAAS